MKNYAKGKPLGNNQVPFYDSPPAETALATTVRDSAATSSILALTEDTTAVEVTATGGTAFVKWLTQTTVDSSVAGTSVISTPGTANFDHAVPADTVRRLVIPIAQGNYSRGAGSMVGANVENGLYSHIAYRGVASVAVIEN